MEETQLDALHSDLRETSRVSLDSGSPAGAHEPEHAAECEQSVEVLQQQLEDTRAAATLLVQHGMLTSREHAMLDTMLTARQDKIRHYEDKLDQARSRVKVVAKQALSRALQRHLAAAWTSFCLCVQTTVREREELVSRAATQDALLHSKLLSEQRSALCKSYVARMLRHQVYHVCMHPTRTHMRACIHTHTHTHTHTHIHTHSYG